MNIKIRKSGSVPPGEKSRKDTRSNITVYAGIITYIISLVIRIPLNGVIGNAGIALFAPAYEIFFLATVLFSYGVSRTMTALIRYRMKRAQYKSARKVFHAALKLSLVASLLLSGLLAAASGFVSEILVLEAMSRKALIGMAPVITLTALVNVFRGYFNGNGFGILVAHSQYIEKIVMMIASISGGKICYEYGQKVGALQQNDMVAYAHGALGVVLGIMVAELVTLLYLLFVFAIYNGTWKKQLLQDSGKRMEGNGEIMGALAINSIPVALVAVLSNIFMLIDQRFFNYCMNRKELGDVRTDLWGSYYGQASVLIGIGAALVCLAVHASIGKTVIAYERDEYHMMRERIGNTVKRLCVMAFPVAVFLAVLAEALVKGLFPKGGEESISILRQGAVIIFLYGIAYLFGQYLMKLRMLKELFLALAVALAAHILSAYLLVEKSLLGAEGILYSVILFVGILAVLCFLFVSRKLKYRQEWIYTFAFPAVSSAIVGLIVMLLCKALPGLVGNIPTVLICCLVGTILYFPLLMLLHVLNEADLDEMPLGGFWLMIGRMIGIL